MPVRTDYLTQCVLNKGNRTQVAWIPEGNAKLGSLVELIAGDWRESGWRVSGVGVRLPEPIVRERSRDYLNTAPASELAGNKCADLPSQVSETGRRQSLSLTTAVSAGRPE